MPHPLAARFVSFADTECRDSSPLYDHLARGVAADEELLEIAAQGGPGQPPPNLFFGAVHHLLAAEPAHALAGFYPSITAAVRPAAEALPEFRAFVQEHADAVIELLRTRLVQTNKVRRCAYLAPALRLAAGRFPGRPLALVEIGTSAGLNLLWDRYRYRYAGGDDCFGDPSSPVEITSTFRGERPVEALRAATPPISHRLGLDLNIVDLTIPEEAAWLRALVWPEHHERRALLDAALRALRATPAQPPLDLRVGDGFADLPRIAAEISAESVLCVSHTHVANQIPPEARERFLVTIATLGAQRDVIHLFNNIRPTLHLTTIRDGVVTDAPLARTDGHARWIEWLLP